MTGGILFFGAGDLALRCSLTLDRSDHALGGCRRIGLRRHPEHLPHSFEGRQADYSDGQSVAAALADLAPEFVVMTLKPLGRDADGYRRGFADATRALCDALGSRPPRQILFVSSSRVYAEQCGAWVDEDSPLAADDPAGAQIVAAEQYLADSGLPCSVLRCAGIYGGRDGFLQRRVATGSLCQALPVHYSNRIHRDDVGGFLAHLLQLSAGGAVLAPIYNVVDDCPVPQAEVETWLAERLGVPEAARHYDARRLSRGHKRVQNKRLHESGYRLRYPDYRAGYSAAIAPG